MESDAIPFDILARLIALLNRLPFELVDQQCHCDKLSPTL